jgi:hypothetical protein
LIRGTRIGQRTLMPRENATHLVRGLRFRGFSTRLLRDIVAASDEPVVFDFVMVRTLDVPEQTYVYDDATCTGLWAPDFVSTAQLCAGAYPAAALYDSLGVLRRFGRAGGLADPECRLRAACRRN